MTNGEGFQLRADLGNMKEGMASLQGKESRFWRGQSSASRTQSCCSGRQSLRTFCERRTRETMPHIAATRSWTTP